MKSWEEIATEFGIIERIKKFESDILSIDGVVSVDFDLTGLFSNIPYVIFLPEYDIPHSDSFYENHRRIRQQCVDVASKHGLSRTDDTLEDYGRHFYIVTRFNPKEWLA